MSVNDEQLTTFLQKLSSDMGNDEQITQYDFYNYRSYFLNDNLLKMLCLTKYDEDMYGFIKSCVIQLIKMYFKGLGDHKTRNVNKNIKKIVDNIIDIKKQMKSYELIDKPIIDEPIIFEEQNINLVSLIKNNEKKKYNEDKTTKNIGIVNELKLIYKNSIETIINNKEDNEDLEINKLLFSIIQYAVHFEEVFRNAPTLSAIKILLQDKKHIKTIKDIHIGVARKEEVTINNKKWNPNTIDFGDMCKALNILYCDNSNKLNYDENKLAKQFYEFDDDCSGTIEYNEFNTWIVKNTASNSDPPQPQDPRSSTTSTITRTSFNELMKIIVKTPEYEHLKKYKDNEKEIDKLAKQEKDEKEIDKLKQKNNVNMDMLKYYKFQRLSKRFDVLKQSNKYEKIYKLYMEINEIDINFKTEIIKIDKTSYDRVEDELKKKKEISHLNQIFKVTKFKTPYYMQYVHF